MNRSKTTREEYIPAAHAEHDVAPVDEYSPAEHSVQAVCPRLFEYDPAAQLVQALAEVAYVPA